MIYKLFFLSKRKLSIKKILLIMNKINILNKPNGKIICLMINLRDFNIVIWVIKIMMLNLC